MTTGEAACSSRVWWAAAGLLAAGAAAHAFVYPPWIDDAYIFFRYARNVLAGHGAVFNPGEYVEGYTSPLWLALLVGGMAAGLPAVWVARALGAVCCALAVLVIARVPDAWGLPRRAAYLAAAAIAAFGTTQAFYAGAGMETPLFGLLLALSGVLLVREAGRGAGFPWSAAAVALTALARPEGMLLVLLGTLVMAVHSAPVNRRRRLGVWLACAAGPLLLHEAWRVWYYGALLPNTFYAKTGFHPLILARGGSYAGRWLLENGGWPLLGLAGLILLQHRRKAAWVLVALVVLIVLATVLEGGDWMPLYRFLGPLVPILALGVAALLDALPDRWPARARLAGATLLVAFVLLAQVRLALLNPYAVRYDYHELHARMWPAVGRWIEEHTQQGRYVVLGPIGMVGYHCTARLSDYFGIVNAAVAKSPKPFDPEATAGHDSSNPDAVLALEPQYIFLLLLPARSEEDAMRDLKQLLKTRAHLDLALHPEFRARYRPRPVFLEGFERYVVVFERTERASGPS